MSRVQLALNVSDLDEAITFYSKLFATEPAKVRPGYANFAVADPPLKLVLIEGNGEPGSLNHLGVEVEIDRRGRRHRGAAAGRGTAHRDRRRGRVLLRRAGQGVGRRTRRTPVGDLHRARRRRDGARRAAHACSPATDALCCADAPGVGRALLLVHAADREHRPRAPRDGRGDRHRAAGCRRRRLRHLRAASLA